MKNLLIKKLIAGLMTLVLLSVLAVPNLVGATGADECGEGEGQTPCVVDTTGAGDIPQIGDLNLGTATLSGLITSILGVIMGFLGVIAVLIILWGGFIWMTASGEPDKVDKAKKMIYSGIIGLVVIFAAYAIATFVISQLTTITGATPGAE